MDRPTSIIVYEKELLLIPTNNFGAESFFDIYFGV